MLRLGPILSVRKAVEHRAKLGPVRDLNPGPLAPKARIIPLDQRAEIREDDGRPPTPTVADPHATWRSEYTIKRDCLQRESNSRPPVVQATPLLDWCSNH